MATANLELNSQEEYAGEPAELVGIARISIDYDDTSPWPVLALRWQNTTSQACFVQLTDADNADIPGASATLPPGTQEATADVTSLALHMSEQTNPKTQVTTLVPPNGCRLRWPA